MKSLHLIPLCALALTLGACTSNKHGQVVKKAYVHKYGVPLAKEAWDSQGRSGQIITTRKDGVVITENFEQGQLHGDTTHTFAHSSRIQHIETYHRGSLIAVTENYPSGLPMRKETYLTGGSQTITHWYENGVPQLVEEYQDGKLVKGEYYTQQHELESQVTSGEGLRVRRDAFGNILSKDEIKQGEMVVRNTYHSDGGPHEWIPFTANEINGQKKVFARDGSPERMETWVMGSQEGPTTFYENGIKVAEVSYKDSARHGSEKRYKDGKVIVEEISWKNGKRHGPKKTFLEGKVYTDWFFEGQAVTHTMFKQRASNG